VLPTERQDYGANWSTAVRTLTLVATFWFPKFFLTSAGCGAVSLIGRDGLDIHRYGNRGRPENGDHHSRIRIGPESATGYIRTDIESGDKADAKQGTAYQPSPQE
jgi:hypothetical protein